VRKDGSRSKWPSGGSPRLGDWLRAVNMFSAQSVTGPSWRGALLCTSSGGGVLTEDQSTAAEWRRRGTRGAVRTDPCCAGNCEKDADEKRPGSLSWEGLRRTEMVSISVTCRGRDGGEACKVDDTLPEMPSAQEVVATDEVVPEVFCVKGVCVRTRTLPIAQGLM